MTRDKFLQELRIALQGRVSQKEVNEQLRYYENYIIEESRKGKTEEEVLAELGNPRLIAKTIFDTCGEEGYYEGQTAEKQLKKNKIFHFRRWQGCILSVIIIALFLAFLVRIGILLFPVLAGAVMIGAIVYLIFMIFFENKK